MKSNSAIQYVLRMDLDQQNIVELYALDGRMNNIIKQYS